CRSPGDRRWRRAPAAPGSGRYFSHGRPPFRRPAPRGPRTGWAGPESGPPGYWNSAYRRSFLDKQKTDFQRSPFSVLALPIFPARLQASIFGADELNFRVRDGNGWTLIAINTNLLFFEKKSK